MSKKKNTNTLDKLESKTKDIGKASASAVTGTKVSGKDDSATSPLVPGGTKKTTAAVKTAAATPNYSTAVPNVFGETKDPEAAAAYLARLDELDKVRGALPNYENQYAGDISRLYAALIERDPFRYDSKTDPLYQQYVQDYVTQGKLAARDALGKTAALTGGYGSSWAQMAAQQQYDQYLQKLGDELPKTYGMALDAYKAEGDRLNDSLDAARGLEKSDYQKYLDELDRYDADVKRAQTAADTAYERMTAAEKQNYARQKDEYARQKDAYNRLVALIKMGYTPTEADFAAAGLSSKQGYAIR